MCPEFVGGLGVGRVRGVRDSGGHILRNYQRYTFAGVCVSVFRGIGHNGICWGDRSKPRPGKVFVAIGTCQGDRSKPRSSRAETLLLSL